MRRPRPAPDQGLGNPGATGGGSAASRRIHARNARSSGRCREAAVVMRQQRSGASSWRSKSGTRIRRSSSWGISIWRPIAAPKRYAKQNLLAQSLSNIAYENKPGFRSFQERAGLPFAAKAIFKRTDLNDRQALYISLANHCWSPDRLNDI